MQQNIVIFTRVYMAKKRKKRAKKHSGNMDIALSYRIDKLPRRRPVSKREFFRRTIAFIDKGQDFPRGWRITLRWRNAEDDDWREDEFRKAISESREGFVKLVRRRLVRDRSEL